MDCVKQSAICVVSFAFAVCGCAKPAPVAEAPAVEKEAVEAKAPEVTAPAYPTQGVFGDTHLHTSFSFDAGTFGVRLGPDDAYRFAKGEELLSSTGVKAKLAKPLDFLVVADHSENLFFSQDS